MKRKLKSIAQVAALSASLFIPAAHAEKPGTLCTANENIVCLWGHSGVWGFDFLTWLISCNCV